MPRKATQEIKSRQKRRLEYNKTIFSMSTRIKSGRAVLTSGRNRCMRRLQGNLSYMAALADRKPEVKAPPCPAFLSPPPLNLRLKLRPQALGDGSENKTDPAADREERERSIKDLYQRLQAVFPGFDPKQEPAYRSGGSQGQKPNHAMANQGSPTVQKTPQLTNMAGPS